MPDYLTSLVARSLGRLDSIQPRPSSRFEPESSTRYEFAAIKIEEYRDVKGRGRSRGDATRTHAQTEQPDAPLTPEPPERGDRARAAREERSEDVHALESSDSLSSDRRPVSEPHYERESPPEPRQEVRSVDNDISFEPAAQATYPLSYQHGKRPEPSGEWSFSRQEDADLAGNDAEPSTPHDDRVFEWGERAIWESAPDSIRDDPAWEFPDREVRRAADQPHVSPSDADIGFEPSRQLDHRESATGVRITIGRVEVRAAPPVPSPPPKPAPRARFTSRLSLDDYLRRTRKGRR
jgi:hypothetical protein